MKKSQIAAQLYSFRDFIKTPAGVRDTLRRLRASGYEAVQLSSALPPMPECDLNKMLQDEGFAAPTAHEGAASLINDPQKIIDHLSALDCRHVAYPYPHWVPTGEGETVALAEEINRAALIYKKAGITLAYHNHAIEFNRFNGRPMLEIIYDNAPDLEGELDTFWVQRGGANPLAWIQKLAGRMQVLHLKDAGVNAGSEFLMKPIGAGNLDWPCLIDAAEKGGVQCYVVEHDANCLDPFASFAESMKYLIENFVR